MESEEGSFQSIMRQRSESLFSEDGGSTEDLADTKTLRNAVRTGHMVTAVMGLLCNEPSLGLYRIAEHVDVKGPALIALKVRVGLQALG